MTGPQIALIVIGSLLLLVFLAFFIIGGHFYRTSFLRRKGDKQFAENEPIEDKQTHYRVWMANQPKEEYTMKLGLYLVFSCLCLSI